MKISRPPLDTEIVNSESRFAAVIQRVFKEPRVGLDLETDNFFRYPEHVSLIQVSVPNDCYIIDPLKIDDVTSLGYLLADPKIEKIFHSADYDIRSLDREWGFRLCSLFDTAIGAAFLGLRRLGLAAVLKDILQITLTKDPKLQRQDWSQRPLSDESLIYAADDVRHLLTLREVLGERLQKLGRVEWVKEECRRLASIRHTQPDPDTAFLSMKGSRSLDARGLAILKSLVAFREQEALRLGRPPFRVLSNAVFLEISAFPDVNLNDLKGLGRYGREPYINELRTFVVKGMEAEPVTRPQLKRQDSRHFYRTHRASHDRRLKALKKWRAFQGDRLGLEPALLWPAPSLERLASNPDSLQDELMSHQVRQWQQEEFGDSLRANLGTIG